MRLGYSLHKAAEDGLREVAIRRVWKQFCPLQRDAAKYFSILVTSQHLSPLLGDMKKPTRPKNSETTSPTAKKSVKGAESTTVSAKSTPEENFTKLIELHKAKGPVPFRPAQRDYKRQEKLVSVDSLSKITFDDGLFKDEADLNGFLRWILRCQAKREAGTLEP
jgi:hypothetical protein